MTLTVTKSQILNTALTLPNRPYHSSFLQILATCCCALYSCLSASALSNTNFQVFYQADSQKLRKVTVSFVMSVRPFARSSAILTGRIFIKFDSWVFFEILLRKLKYDNDGGYFAWKTSHENPMYIYDSSLLSPYNKKFVSEKFADKIKTSILC
jgi:hypothetical protein